MQFGFSTYFFTKGDVGGIVDAIAASGVNVAEIVCEVPHVLSMDDAFLLKMKEMVKEGFRFSMHTPFIEVNLGSFFGDIRQSSKKRIKESLEMAYRIGCDLAVVHPGYSLLTGKMKDIVDKTRDTFIEDMNEIIAYGKERGLRIALENVHMPFFFFFEIGEFTKLHELLPGCGVAFDVGHAYLTKRQKGESDPEGSMIKDLNKIGLEHLFHVHLHNNFGEKDDHMFLRGRIDMKRIIKGLQQLGYDGKVIVESYDMEEHGIQEVMDLLNGMMQV